MTQLSDQLPELQSRLLLYAAGELPADEAEALERELAADPSTRQALAEVSALLVGTAERLTAADAAQPVLPRQVRRASDRAVSAVRSWALAEAETRRRAALEPVGLTSQGAVWRWARWPLAAAAVLVVGLIVWTHSTEPTQLPGEVAQAPESGSAGSDGTGVEPIPGAGRTVGTEVEVATNDTGILDQLVALFGSPGGLWDSESTLAQLDTGSDLDDELLALRELSESDED